MYKVILTKTAIKSLLKIPLDYQQKVKETSLKLEKDPFTLDLKKLNPFFKATHRLRLGSYRLFLSINTKTKEVVIADIIRRTSITYN